MNPPSTDAERWAAVVGRDRTATDFIFAVVTTGVYCRPSCPSRRPNRANVKFFATPSEAERGGFRACLKCRPADSALPEMIQEACRLLDSADEEPSLEELARNAGLSISAFQRRFKTTVGLTPKRYAAARRLERFKAYLREQPSVTEAIYAAGFGSGSRCYETSSDHLGMTPGEYRTGGVSQKIRFAVSQCSLGWLSVGATALGVCIIELGDGPDELRAGVAARFPRAEVSEGGPEFAEWVRQVVAFVDSPPGPFPLPLDIRGTAFQRRVWEALQKIPAGATASYAEVAERIGEPNACRAVAGACAANPVAVVVPCHRVVRTGGAISGYRWGVERKRKLLAKEASVGA